jgi:hypothetical protein
MINPEFRRKNSEGIYLIKSSATRMMLSYTSDVRIKLNFKSIPGIKQQLEVDFANVEYVFQ